MTPTALANAASNISTPRATSLDVSRLNLEAWRIQRRLVQDDLVELTAHLEQLAAFLSKPLTQDKQAQGSLEAIQAKAQRMDVETANLDALLSGLGSSLKKLKQPVTKS